MTFIPHDPKYDLDVPLFDRLTKLTKELSQLPASPERITVRALLRAAALSWGLPEDRPRGLDELAAPLLDLIHEIDVTDAAYDLVMTQDDDEPSQ